MCVQLKFMILKDYICFTPCGQKKRGGDVEDETRDKGMKKKTIE